MAAAAELLDQQAAESRAAVEETTALAQSGSSGRPEPEGNSSSEEELPLLPRHTKVLVTGNNRTKQALVGASGVVKKSVGLGGWHWLVLSNGQEVRLQRNALTVVEPPTGNEEDFSDMDDEPNADSLAVLLPRTRPRRPPRPLAPSPDLPAQRPARPVVRQQHYAHLRVNLGQLETAALKRYRRHYRLPDCGPNASKEQLVSAVSRHFMTQTVDENKVIALFVQAARRHAAMEG